MFVCADDAAPPATVEVVIVNPPRLAPLGGEAAFAAQQIDAQALKDSPRLDEVLKRAPGVSLFRRTGSDAANPTIQGLSLRSIAPSGAGRALVTLDGAPQNDPFGGWVIWSALPPEGLDGATVVRGAGAGPYGAGALTGVVALQERGAGEGLAALDISAGDHRSGRLAVAGGTAGLLIVATGESTNGYVPVRAGRGAADRPTDLHDASLAMRWQHEVRGAQAAIRLSVYDERRGAGLAGANSDASGASATFTLAQRPDDGVGGWRLQGWVRASDLKNTSVAVAANRATTTPANDQYGTPALGYGFNGAAQGRSGDWSWEVGGDLRAAKGQVNERFRFLNGAFTRGREAGGETLTGGVYVEGVLDREAWLLTGGLRVDGWESRAALRRERDLATGVVLLDQPGKDASGVKPTVRFGVRYAVGPSTWARAAAYAGFRPPTLNELHRPFRVGNDVTEVNPALKPESLYGVEAGVGGDGAARWTVTGFYNRLEDPITNVTVGFGPATFPVGGLIPAGGVLRQRRNAGAVDAWGVEGDVAGNLTPTLFLLAAASWTRAKVDGGAEAPQLTGRRPAQTARLTATAGAVWQVVAPLSLSADLRYESARFEDDLNQRRLSPALGADVRAGWRVARDTEVYLAAENLFDAAIEIGETADGIESFAAPRMVRVGVAIRR